MALLTDAQFMGGAPALSGDNATPKPGKLLTDVQFAGGPAPKPPVEDQSAFTQFGNPALMNQLRKQGERPRSAASVPAAAGAVLGTAGQAMDLTLGIPKQMAGVFAYPLANIGAMLGGEKPADAAQFAADVKQGLLPDWLSQPFAVIAKSLGPEAERAYSDNPLGWAMGHLSSATEKSSKSMGTKLGLPPETVQNFYDDVMGILGYAGLKAGAKGIDEGARARFEKAFDARQAATTKPRYKLGAGLKPAAEAPPEPAVFRSGRTLSDAEFTAAKPEPAAKPSLLERFGDRTPEEYRAIADERAAKGLEHPGLPIAKAAAVAGAGAAGYAAGSALSKQPDPFEKLAALGGATAMFIPAIKGDARVSAYERMKASGASRLKRWQSTGITEMPGVGLVEELSDAGARLRIQPQMVNGKAVAWLAAGHELPLGEAINHPELFSRFPELKNLLVRPTNQPGMAGEYHPRTGTIYINHGTPEEVTSTLLHEVNHYFVPGTSPKEFSRRGIKEPTATRLYERQYGEAIARATEARRLMTDEERLATPPWETFRQMGVPEEQWVLGQGGVSAAVKEKGGMWHPEAVERLARPLADRLVGVVGEGGAQDFPSPKTEWATKSIRNYLNKHAGTATDPLRDVRIPMLGEDVRWEDVTDKLVQGAPARYFGDIKGAKPEELVHTVETQIANSLRSETRAQTDTRLESSRALQSYLSHVGDYLREFVPPERLQQYDLVRAVRETAAQDARQAAKMAKARATGEGTVPYKTYPDGMRWVEVQSDEALKNEGDVMGHCVGGYCEMVHEGQSKIYSLRDAKGMSHVTVEVRPATETSTPYQGRQWFEKEASAAAKARIGEPPSQLEGFNERQVDKHRAWNQRVFADPEFQAWERSQPSDIIQIKGKQNRAPVAAYLPYVQDFVRSGKWGEVGDLENARLTHIEEGHPLTKEQGAGRIPPGYYTSAELQERGNPEALRRSGLYDRLWHEDRAQRGAADPRQLAAIAAAGVGAVAGAALNPEHPWLGGALGAVAGAGALRAAPLVGKGLMDATKAALQSGSLYERGTRAAGELVPGPISRAFARDSRIRIKAQMDAAEVFTRREELKANRAINQVLELAPREADRVMISHALEAGGVAGLPPKLQQAAGIVQDFFKELGEKGLAAGTIKDLVDQYVTHVFGREALPLIDEMLRERNLGTASSVFGKARRGPPTIAEVNAWLAKKGAQPITADIAKILTAYSNSMIKAIANRTLIDTLKQTSAPAIKNGKTIQRAVVTTKPLGNYVPLGKYNLYVHPDILPALRFVFEQDSMPGIIRGVEAVNTALKRTAVSFSLFHAKSLVDAMAGGARLAKGPMLAGGLAGGLYAVATDQDPITYAMIGVGLGMAAPGLKLTAQAAAPKLFGENRFVKALRTGDPAMAKLIDLSFEGGLQYSLKGGGLAVEEASKGFYEGLEFARQGLDKLVPGAGKAVHGVEVVNRAMDTFMWDRLHTAMKLEVFAEKYETLLQNNARAHARNPAKVPLMPEVQIAEAAASYTNDIFGGLNWRRIAEEGFTRWGRDLKMGVYRPSGRRVLRLGMFAPDWTISTTRAALKAFGPVVGQPEGGGLRGLLEPRTVTDLHRQYMLRSAFYYAMIGDGLNMAFTGHHLWQNNDPTYIELGDGRKMQFSKHTMEPYHWMMHPVQQGLNKLGQVPKEALNQAFGTEYLNPRESKQGQIYAGPKMKEGRGKHLLQQLSPIGVQQFAEGPVGGITGAVGMPIYGKTREQIAREREARKATTDRLEAARRRREKALAR